MADESTRQAAQEYLATRLSEERLTHEGKLNRETAIALAPAVWKNFATKVIAKCTEWNSVTQEQSLVCKETILGDLRIWCASRREQITIHYDSPRRLIILKNSARPESEGDTILSIEGQVANSGREARLVRNNQPINEDMLILGHLRLLAGLARRAEG